MPKSAVLRKNFAPVKWNEEQRQQQQRWDVEKRATAAAAVSERKTENSEGEKKEKRDRGAAQKFITNNVKYKNIWKTRSRIFLFFVVAFAGAIFGQTAERGHDNDGRRWCWESWGCARISREKGEKPKRKRTRRALNNVCFKNHAVLLGSRDRPSQQRKLLWPISTSSDVVMSGAGGGREGHIKKCQVEFRAADEGRKQLTLKPFFPRLSPRNASYCAALCEKSPEIHAVLRLNIFSHLCKPALLFDLPSPSPPPSTHDSGNCLRKIKAKNNCVFVCLFGLLDTAEERGKNTHGSDRRIKRESARHRGEDWESANVSNSVAKQIKCFVFFAVVAHLEPPLNTYQEMWWKELAKARTKSDCEEFEQNLFVYKRILSDPHQTQHLVVDCLRAYFSLVSSLPFIDPISHIPKHCALFRESWGEISSTQSTFR